MTKDVEYNNMTDESWKREYEDWLDGIDAFAAIPTKEDFEQVYVKGDF